MKSNRFLVACAVWLASSAVPVAQTQQQYLDSVQQSFTGIIGAPPVILSTQLESVIYDSWQIFLWSVQGTAASLQDGSQRATPSTTAQQSGQSPLFNSGDNPLLFESFYHRAEVFPYYEGSPPSFDVAAVPYYRFRPFATGEPGFSTAGNYVNLDETNQIGQNMLVYRQSGPSALPVLYMAKVGGTEAVAASETSAPTRQASWVLAPQAIEIKTAWRRVSDFPDYDPQTRQSPTASRMHQAPATYYVDSGGQPTAQSDTFAMIGLSFIHKRSGSTAAPIYIFATFEHVDAVTRDQNQNITDPAYEAAYCLLEYEQGDPQSAQVYGAYDSNTPGLAGGQNALRTVALPTPGRQSCGYQTVVQPPNITSEVNDANNAVAALIQQLSPGNIWSNYRLKGVQFQPTSDETSADYYLANIVIESSPPGLQLFRGGRAGQDPTSVPPSTNVFYNTRNRFYLSGFPLSSTGFGPSSSPAPQSLPGNVSVGAAKGQPVPTPQYNMGGCMGCHGIAQQMGGDFSFLTLVAGGVGNPVDTVPAAGSSPEEMLAHRLKSYLRRARYLFPKND